MSTSIQFNPARTLRDVFNAVDPARPLQNRNIAITLIRSMPT